MNKIANLKKQLFGTTNFVCGGHGAVWPSHGSFIVPGGVKIHFYVADGKSLPNSVGQQIDQILAGGKGPVPLETVHGGQECINYHLFSPRAGGYLKLKMSSQADSKYISTTDKEVGIALKEICRLISQKHPAAIVHWSACRSHEPENMRVSWSKPKYSAALKRLGG